MEIDAQQFFILCVPIMGILKFFINLFFWFGRLISKSNFDKLVFRLIFLILKFDFSLNPYVTIFWFLIFFRIDLLFLSSKQISVFPNEGVFSANFIKFFFKFSIEP